MFPLFNRKKHNEEQDVPRKEERKSTLDDFQNSGGDLTLLDKDDMSKLEGGQTGQRTFTDLLGWTSSLGDTIPQ